MTMVHEDLRRYRRTWDGKPVLRAIYGDYYRRIVARCRPGRTLEIGGGSGNLKDFLADVVSTDVLFAPWLDAVADAQALPFADGTLANIVMVDVLHHIPRPRAFLAEAARVLAPGGRVICVEPGITPVSWLLFKLMHHEPVVLGADPLAETALSSDNPYDSNQAIPTLLFGRHRARLERAFPQLRVVERRPLGLFAYPLSGGFKAWSLMPARAVAATHAVEDRLAPVIGRLCAFRLLGVLEKRATAGTVPAAPAAP
jgi:SAM-dependent methyltransferase